MANTTAPHSVPPLVLKIGGSLAETGRLANVLALVAASARRIAIVPGGGMFANAVREAQAERGFSDAEAHAMAILAMHRMALDFASLEPKLIPVESIDAITTAWDEGGMALWLPFAMTSQAPELPQDWSITSDGLAAWLAVQLEPVYPGIEVALVKSCEVPESDKDGQDDQPSHLARLAAAGITDAQFPLIAGRAGLCAHVIGTGSAVDLLALLNPGHAPAADAARG